MDGMHVFPIYFLADKSLALCSRQHASVFLVLFGYGWCEHSNSKQYVVVFSTIQNQKYGQCRASLNLPLAHATKTQGRPTICRQEETFYDTMFIAAQFTITEGDNKTKEHKLTLLLNRFKGEVFNHKFYNNFL